MAVKCPKCQAENPGTARFCLDCGTRLGIPETPQISVTKTLETTTDELTRGVVFAGRYEIIEELGTGGMGRVYRAFDKKISEEVALKLIKPEITAEKRTVERFRNELKIARKIRHKNVCGMFDLQEEGKTLFITMEYVRGEDLKSFLHRSKQLTISTAISIAHQVAEGLAEAHKLGIVHRDLKPHNIMIDNEGNAKIMDFGIARSLEAKGITAEGMIVGTPQYMSPEQVEGKEVDGRSDIYSLGVILYEMATGRVPFEADTALAVAYKHKNEQPVSPKVLNPQVLEDLSGLILKCLEKAPDKRFQTADELYAELEKIKKGLPATAVTTPAPRRAPLTSREITIKFTARKLIVPGLALIAVVAAVVLAIVFLPHRPPQQRAGPIHKQITHTGKASSPAISADGKFFAYVDGLNIEEQKVMVQDMISGQAIEVFHGRDCSGLRWSPDGSELSFYGQGSDSTRAAFIVPRLGGKPRRLAGMESSPVWSLTGTELLHFSWEKSQFIFTDKTTGESKSISLDKSIAENIEDFDLSPSGKLIAFTTSDSEGKYSIWIITADGSRKNKIIEDTEYWLGSPRWSPRGDAIYYLQDAEEAEDIRKITVSPDSGKPAKPPSPILEGHQVGSCFTLTNDGTQLFYERGPSIVNIWQATLEGSEKGQKVDVKQLTTGTSVHQSPSLSPDGKLVAYATATGYSANIYVMPAGGGPSQQITFFNSWCASPVWSPDGKEIAFFSNQGGSYKIWKVSAAGGQPHQFAKSEGAYWPIWAPGQKILYRSSKNNNLWFIDPATEAETSLFKINPTDYIMWPKYSPDGKKIVVLWQKESGKEPGLWLISLDDSSSVMLRKGRAFPIGWSADGKWIYASERGAGRLEILAISSETGQSKPWLSLPPNPEMGQIITMFCSAADGTHFVFSARKSQPDIWLIENFDPEIK